MPFKLRAQVRMASVVSACDSRSGPLSSTNARVSDAIPLMSSVTVDAESSKEAKSGPAPLNARNVSSSRSGMRSLGRLSTKAPNWSSIGPTAWGIVVSPLAIREPSSR